MTEIREKEIERSRRELLKLAGLGVSAGLLGLLGGREWGFREALAQSQQVTIEPNSFVSEVDYIVFGEDTDNDNVLDVFYARNGRTGQIDYEGDNATVVIENALNVSDYIFIKGDITWIPTNNSIPGYKIIESDYGLTIQTQNPDTDYLNVGPYTMLRKVKIYDKRGVDIGLSPNSPRRIGVYYNATPNILQPTNYPDELILLDISQPGSDNPGIGVNQRGAGDAYWAGVVDNGVGFRVHVNETDPTKTGVGITAVLFGGGEAVHLKADTQASGRLLYLENVGDVPSIWIQPPPNNARCNNYNRKQR